ncbi:hypothetical protein N8K70_13465 [Microbacterium betulae]|uniref:DUF7882 domain-containing protein n=1 Tax=Microbacterium betulae TaxID=2981139 RepID=A0AA97FIY0_9MICO|nr:hypothetical protein [Microbacterium sp. AB]WOF22387.1 hypothetical protein N8K70_13465 [Microbacterium sp. AB]
MGRIFYGTSGEAIEIEDGLLAHVQTVAITKLRRGESFCVSWMSARGRGRETVWVQPSIPIRFVTDEDAVGGLDRDLLTRLMDAANSHHGLDLSSEPSPGRELVSDATQGSLSRAA